MVAYDTVVLQVVPRVHVPTAEAVGVALHARQAGFIGVRWLADAAAVAERSGLDPDLLMRYWTGIEAVCAGGAEGGPVGLLPPSERFHWLAATRSTVLQPGPVRTGLCDDPEAALGRIAETLAPAPSR